jgi:O-antigen biosynthesis protein
MKFTGERYMPSVTNAQITYEHWHRYLFTRNYIHDKVVLDIACGEGYGAFYMAGYAKSVIGIDISDEAVAYATSTYKKENLRFIQCDAAAINISDAAFADVVVSFETIEHLSEDQQRAFLDEIKRLLKPDGVLIMSTPDKLLYTDTPDYHNEYHLKEFYSAEFVAFLKSRFQHTAIFNQKLFPVSLIWAEPLEQLQAHFINFIENRYEIKDTFSSAPMYLIGICSDAPVPEKPASVLLDENATLLAELTDYIRSRDLAIAALRNELAELQSKLQGG